MGRSFASQGQLWRGGGALVLAATVSTAGASGFQIREQSAAALGNAMAGAASIAEDPSYLAYNPASIGRLDGTQVAGSLSYIDSSFTLDDAQASTTAGVPVTGDTPDGGTAKAVPAAMLKWSLSERLDAGLGIYSAFGLATDYDREWIGRYHAVESELVTISFNPVLSFEATDRLTLAGGLIAQRADATLSSAVDFGSIGAANRIGRAVPTTQDGFVEVTGDDWGYGVNLGLLYEFSERTRGGIGIRSQINHTLTGSADYEYDQAGVGQTLNSLGGSFTDGTSGKADLSTPATVNAGLYHAYDNGWAVMANVEWTRWSSFDELRVEFGDNTPDSVTSEEWDDTFMVSLGANYQANDRWLLRGGVGYDQSPVPDAEHRTPRIPDNDRRWLTLGATWTPASSVEVTAAWLHLFISDSEIDQNATATNENASRGNLSGDYDGSADVFSLQATYRF